VTLLVAQTNGLKEIRGLANWQGDVADDFPQAVGKGYLAITVDPSKGKQRYQGIVELAGESLAQVIENYFQQSEQLPTFMLLAAGKRNAAGLLLQLLPQAKQQDENFWQHVETMARTLTEVELLQLSPETVLHRLFHQEKIRVFEPEKISFVCRCSRDAMA